MRDVVEMNLSKAVNVTTTTFIRTAIQELIDADGLDGPPVELVRFHVFIHCTEGNGRHMVDFHDYEISPGTAIWIRPGQVQRWSDSHGDFDADVVVFESSTITDLPLFDQFIGTTSVANLNADSDPVRQQTEWMAADLEKSQDHATAAAVVGVILRLFARQAQGGSDLRDTPARRLATAFVDSVDLNIGERSVAWHAKEVGASTRSVARATAETLSQRPKEVIDARVILEARRRLAWSSDDIATIARDLRFSEASNFTKFFRTRTGASPSAFRDAVTHLAPLPGR
ncbi:MAG: helix-turn-helix domain-containing protein [Acidimicrobiales bacterium]